MKRGLDKQGELSGAKKAKTASELVLPWMRVPVTIKAKTGVALQNVGGLDVRLQQALQKGLGYSELFPVQSTVWQELAGGASYTHDICLAAPTGSGKTLAYSLPVLNALARRKTAGNIHCLQALVVLPTRELAAQVKQWACAMVLCSKVHELLQVLATAVDVTCVLAAARSSIAAEAIALCSADGSDEGGADVMVATPGRLMAHLQGTVGFTLRHLRFLVVDETDRLLRQNYQGWLAAVLQALSAGHCLQAWSPDAAASPSGDVGAVVTALPFAGSRPVKLVVSATLTRDPSKLQRLALHCPRYIAASAEDHRYHLPCSLQEWKVVTPGHQKPLALLALLHELAGQSTVIFTSSLTMTHRLFQMLQATKNLPDKVMEFSSSLTVQQRTQNLAAFKSGAVKVLVASDAMSRGMDVEAVQNVISYDAPVYAKTYVHRAGRTARAGRAGCVFTLLRPEEVHHFKAMLRKADNNYVRDYKLACTIETYAEDLQSVLGRTSVRELIEAEPVAVQDSGDGAAVRAMPPGAT